MGCTETIDYDLVEPELEVITNNFSNYMRCYVCNGQNNGSVTQIQVEVHLIILIVGRPLGGNGQMLK